MTHIWFAIRFRRTHLSKYVYKLPAELVSCILPTSEVDVGCLFVNPKANSSQGILLDLFFLGKTIGVHSTATIFISISFAHGTWKLRLFPSAC